MRGKRIARRVLRGQSKPVTLMPAIDHNAQKCIVARSTTKCEIFESIMPSRNEYDELNDDSELTVAAPSRGSQLYSALQIDWTLEYM